MNFRNVFLSLMLAITGGRLEAAVPGSLSATWTGSQAIPDNSGNGVTFLFSLSPANPVLVTNITVDLVIAGGWDGDLYAYLSHGSGFSVLLNRIGSSTNNPGGSGASGMNVEFSDSYLTDIHTGAGNPPTGNFAPDGRFVNPFTALATDPRTAMLSSFNNLDPSGTWTLFLADVSPLGVSTVLGWTVTVGTAVPEPDPAALLGLGIAMAGAAKFLRAPKG